MTETNQVIHGDCMDVMREMEDNSIDTIITDPPYHLGSISKRFTRTSLGDDNDTAANARNGSNQYARLSTGFMGKSWDGGGIAFQPELWAEMLRVAKPGATLLAFGGTRTHHRLMVAIEDAGWEIRDCLMWLYGSGFPKSHNISKSIDKATITDCTNCDGKGFVMPELPSYEELVIEDPDNHIIYEDWLYLQTPEGIIARQCKCADCNGTGKVKGKEREVVGHYQYPADHPRPNKDMARWSQRQQEAGERTTSKIAPAGGNRNITAPATEAAATWEGWGSGGLKPAFEPIVLAHKPLTIVPFDDIITETNVLIRGALCLLLSSVNDAEKILKLSQVDSIEGKSVFVALLVALLDGEKSGELYEKMDMFNSPETVLMCLNIATLWNNILGEVLKPESMSITKTGIEVITGLKTLKYLLSTIIPESIIQDVFQADGRWQSASNAGNNLAAEKTKPDNIQKHFAAVIATWKTGKNGTLANNAANSLRQIIPSVYSVLRDVLTILGLKQKPELSPAYEPIIYAQKPIEQNYANNAQVWGVAGLNIDGSRIGTETIETANTAFLQYNGQNTRPWQDNHESYTTKHTGRWPANVLLSHSEGCVRRGEKQVRGDKAKAEIVSIEDKGCYGNGRISGLGGYADPNGLETVADWECVDGCPIRILDEQAGVRKSGGSGKRHPSNNSMFVGTGGSAQDISDSGSASRFFYTAKAPGREKWFYCQLCQAAYPNKERDNHGHDIDQGQRKHIIAHPTVKPQSILEYLCKLTKTPTGGIVLDPFAGSGTTGLACIETGRDFILIEKESDYYEIAKARVEMAMNEPRQAELF